MPVAFVETKLVPGSHLSRVVAAFALCLVLAACDASQGTQIAGGGPPPVRVKVLPAVPQTIPRTISSVGSLESPEMTTVASEVEGRVVELDLPEGRLVEAGHVLARLDDALARAALSVTRARLTNARNRLRRLETLRAESVSSEQAYDDAKSDYDGASGAYQEAKTRLEKTAILAPFAGVLGLRRVNPGQYVSGGTAIVELTQVDPLELLFSIPQRYASLLALEQTVQGVVGRCGPRFEGRVDAIDPRVDSATRSVRMKATVPNPEGRLYPGMAVSLRLVVGAIDDAIVVPQEAIVRQGTKHIIYTIDAEDRAQQHTVMLGQFFADGVWVRSGLEPGARVVAAGQQKLRPGSPTEPLPFEPTENPNLALGAGDGEACRDGV